MITHEAWYKEAGPRDEELSRLLRDLDPNKPETFFEAYKFCQRNGLKPPHVEVYLLFEGVFSTPSREGWHEYDDGGYPLDSGPEEEDLKWEEIPDGDDLLFSDYLNEEFLQELQQFPKEIRWEGPYTEEPPYLVYRTWDLKGEGAWPLVDPWKAFGYSQSDWNSHIEKLDVTAIRGYFEMSVVPK